MGARTEPGLRIERADVTRWADVATVFGTRGDPSWCWCQYFLTTGRSYEEDPTRNRDALRAEVAATSPGRSLGLIASDGDEPVGWVQLGPRARFPRVTGSRVQRRLADGADIPEDGTWRVTCFVVRVGHRRRGVATALLAAAVETARAAGAARLEGHPVDVAARPNPRASGATLYPGVLTTFLAAGFREIGRTAAARPGVVLDL
jgi:GNAT superfamily N-acetyltransferase